MKCNIFSNSKQINLECPHFLLKVFDLSSYGSSGTLVLTTSLTLILYDEYNSTVSKEVKSGVENAEVGYNIVYIIDELGKVHRSTLSNICSKFGDASWETIHTDDSILKICSNNQGVLMISGEQKLLGFGYFGSVLRSFKTIHVKCFEDFRVIDIDTGDNFVVVLAQKRSMLDFYLENYKNEMSDLKYEGCQMLMTQVFTFGHFGEGDVFKNLQSSIISQFTDIGIFKISCGSSHAAALTIDGRLFLWGFNDSGQISSDVLISYHITPIEYPQKIKDDKSLKNVMDVACGSTSTVIVFNDMSMEILGKNKYFIRNLSLNTKALEVPSDGSDESTVSCPYILGNGTKYAVNQKNVPYVVFTSIINDLQNCHVKVLISERKEFVKLFQPTEHQAIVKSYEAILHLLIMSLKTTKDGLHYLNNCQIRPALIMNAIPLFNEFMEEFCDYFDHICDLLSMYGLNIFDHVSEAVLYSLLFRPVFSLNFFKTIFNLLDSLNLCDDGIDIKDIKEKTIERKQRIETFFAVQNEKIETAKKTLNFWNSSQNKSLLLNTELYLKMRRFVLDSEDVPLKVVDKTNMFASSRFILFEDCLVFISQSEQIYPINLMWLSPYETINKEKYSFKIVTPDNDIKVYTLKLQDRAEWMEKIVQCIAKSVKCPESAIPVHRYGSFNFTKNCHKLYNFSVEGNWLNGKFYANCHIKSPEISYECRIFEPFGELNGIGRIKTSDYIYEGEFEDGKIEGHGLWRSSIMTYKGYFSKEKFSGHGKLIFKDTEYQGEFSDGLRCGYGIENNFDEGTKYIGYWQDDKKHGPGIFIQPDGSYFEGVFFQNNLVGNALALFSNGSYYQGEMASIEAPIRHGMLFFPEYNIPLSHGDLKLSDDDLNLKVKGWEMRGVFGGTWPNLSVTSAKLSLKETFPKIPQRYDFIGAHSTDLKWETLMDNWKMNVFATNDLEDLEYPDRWSRLEEYMQKLKYFHADKSRNFSSSENVHDYKFRKVHKCLIDSAARCTSTTISVKENIFNSTAMLVNSIGMHFEKSPETSDSEDDENCPDLDPEPRWLPHFINSVKNDINNPFNELTRKIRSLFFATYGHWRSKPVPILAEMAIEDWRLIMNSIYDLFTYFFEELPKVRGSMPEETSEMSNSIFEVIMKDEIYSCLLLLYVSKSTVQTDNYNRKLAISSRIPTDELRVFLELSEDILPILDHEMLKDAILILRLFSGKSCPIQKMKVLQTVTNIIEKCGEDMPPGTMTADNLLGIIIFLLIEARVHQLGPELSLLEDLLLNNRDAYRISSLFEFIFTKFKIAYLHIVFNLDMDKLLPNF